MELYRDDVQAIIDDSLNLFEIGKDLKNAEDLATDVMNYILAIESVDDWAEHVQLSIFYDLLRIIQQEVIFSRPIVDFHEDNLNVIVVFANLLFTPGMTIPQNNLRAHELLQNVLNVDPTFEYAQASMAALVLDGGDGLPRDPVKALELYSKVLVTRPDYPFVLARIGNLYRIGDVGITKDETLAHHYFQRALDADSKNLFSLDCLAIMYRDGFGSTPANPRQAYDYFSKILEVEPYSFYALTALADLLINNFEGIPQDLKKGIELLQEALAISPNYDIALAYYAELLRVGGEGVEADRKTAFEILQRLVTNDHTCGGFFASLGEIYLYPFEGMEVDAEKAYECFTKAYELGYQKPFCLNHLGEIMLNREDYDRACELAHASLEKEPKQAFAYWILGTAYNYKEGIEAGALSRSYFEKALECDPNHYPTLYYLGCLLAKDDLRTVKLRAHDLLTHALEINPENHIILYELAKLYFYDEKRQEIAKAIDCLRRAIKVKEDYPSSYTFLGYIIVNQEMQDCYIEACNLFEKALAIDSNDSTSRYYLCHMYIYGNGHIEPNHERARVLIEEFLLGAPNDPEFLELQNLLIEQMISSKQSTISRFISFLKKMLGALSGS